jgi:alkanesulfonate monooxygenase SsuD/methylene tetrahydromethanopterin reductase-like flavin-dependent oxidoreductase (luciferase family)
MGLARWAEGRGYRGLWLVEEPGELAESFSLAALALLHTRRVEVGLLVELAAWRLSTLARALATLLELFGPRVLLALKPPGAWSLDRVLEVVRYLREIWQGRVVTTPPETSQQWALKGYQGRYAPLKPGPLLLAQPLSTEHLSRAGLVDGWLITGSLEEIRDALQTVGGLPAGVKVLAYPTGLGVRGLTPRVAVELAEQGVRGIILEADTGGV